MAEFRAGAAEMDITPPLGTAMAGFFIPRKAEDIHDPLHAKALVLDDGHVQLAMVVLDLLGLGLADVNAIRARVTESTQIPPDHIMVTCTHTHTGPSVRAAPSDQRDEPYMQWMIRRAADAVHMAHRRLQPAQLTTGSGELHGACFCRRWRMRDGTVRMNPEPGDPDIVEPTSPVDPSTGVIYLETPEGKPIAVLAQYGLHYVGTDNGRHISADYFGHFARAMRRCLGDDCVPMLMNGTSGQVNNLNPLRPNRLRGHAQAHRVATALASEVMRVITMAEPETTPRLAAATEALTLPRKTLSLEDVEEAERIVARGDAPPVEGHFSFTEGKQPIPANLCAAYARDFRRIYELNDQTIQSQLQAFRVGNTGWVAMPGEIFVEIGTTIKQQSPLPRTFVIGMGTDYLGYIPTDHALLNEGGYETWPRFRNAVGVGAEGILCDAAARALDRVAQASTP